MNKLSGLNRQPARSTGMLLIITQSVRTVRLRKNGDGRVAAQGFSLATQVGLKLPKIHRCSKKTKGAEQNCLWDMAETKKITNVLIRNEIVCMFCCS